MTTNDEEVLKPLLDRLSRDRVRLVCKVLDRLPDLLDMLDKSKEFFSLADGDMLEEMKEQVKEARDVLSDCEDYSDNCCDYRRNVRYMMGEIESFVKEFKEELKDLKDEVEGFRDESEEYRDECCSIKVDIMELEKTRNEGREG